MQKPLLKFSSSDSKKLQYVTFQLLEVSLQYMHSIVYLLSENDIFGTLH